MARDSLQTLIVYGGGLVIGYYILKSWGVISTPCDPAICTTQCPRGPRYSRGLFGDCDPNYVMCGTLQEDCCCLNASSSTTNTSSWTPLSDYELKNLNSEKLSNISPGDLYKDDRFDVRSGRGKMGHYNFIATK